jgi:hypothetical protein
MDPQKAKDLVRSYFCRLLNEKDVSVCDEMLSPAYVDHDAPEDTPPGPASIKAFVSRFLDDHPDMHVSIGDMLVKDNKVAACLIWKGTNRHTGAPFHQMGAVIIVLDEAGRFVERWSAYAPLDSAK